MRNNKKVAVMIVALALAVCGIIGSTVAWLVAKTESVTNTFTYGDINITLEESDSGDNDGNDLTNEYIMVPGNTIEKDPKVTVKANSEDSWLFVKLDKSENFDSFMEYAMADGWIALDGVDGVFYREVSKTDADAEFAVIKDNKVTVKGDVTKEMLNALDAEGKSDYPKLVVTAYAVQRDADIDAIDTAAEAWALIK